MKNNNLMLALTSAVVMCCGPAALPVSAQVAVPPPMPAFQPLSDQQLDQLLGPIALYPDPLLAQILPAATLPTQIVLADRYLASGGDPGQIDQQQWDPSVQAVARYPAVLQYLDNNLGWTTELGLAFLNQPQPVMDSIQRLRQSAMNLGNLQSTPQEQVVNDGGDIEILPTQPDVIYLPVYQPADVYDQSGYPLSFGVACAFGPWLNCDFDWGGHRLFFWNRAHPRPANWWHQSPAQRGAWLARQGTVWRPEDHRGYAASHAGDRGWGNAAARAPRPNNMIINMSGTAANPRPAATPGRPGGSEVRDLHIPSAPAPAIRPESQGAFVGSESSRDARNFSNRGQESMQTVTRPEPAHVEPAHSEPARSEPAHSEPPESHSAPSRR
jgi:hypothetical protein